MMRMLGWIVLCLGVLAGVGLYFGWFSFSTSSGSTGPPGIHLMFNKDKFSADVNSGKGKATATTIEGNIYRIEAPRQELTLLGKQDQMVTVTVDATTRIKIGEKDGASFGELKMDDRVSVMYEAYKDVNMARTVTVSNRAVTDTRP